MNTHEENFAYKVRHALNEKIDNLPENIAERLVQARQVAVSRKKQTSPIYIRVFKEAFVGVSGQISSPFSWVAQLRLGLPALLLVIGLCGIIHYEEQRHINETAAIDIAVLSDELPPAAYTDIGFSAYLERYGA